MIINKKSLAGTSERNLTPKLYPKPKRLSNSQEAIIIITLIVFDAIILTGFILFVLWIIYQRGLTQWN